MCNHGKIAEHTLSAIQKDGVSSGVILVGSTSNSLGVPSVRDVVESALSSLKWSVPPALTVVMIGLVR